MDMTRTHPPPLQIPIILYNLQPPFVHEKNELVTLMTNLSITIGALMEHFLKGIAVLRLGGLSFNEIKMKKLFFFLHRPLIMDHLQKRYKIILPPIKCVYLRKKLQL